MNLTDLTTTARCKQRGCHYEDWFNTWVIYDREHKIESESVDPSQPDHAYRKCPRCSDHPGIDPDVIRTEFYGYMTTGTPRGDWHPKYVMVPLEATDDTTN